MTADKQSAAEKGRTRKVLWARYVGGADIGHAPARLAMTAALARVNTNGSFDATYGELAALCNTSPRGAKIAAKELADQHYWTVHPRRGRRGIFTFTLVTQSERDQMFYDAEREWKQEKARAEYERQLYFRDWLRDWRDDVQIYFDAEKKFDAQCREQRRAEIDAKQAYQRQVFDAIYARCGNADFAMKQAQAAWAAHRGGRQSMLLPDILAGIAAMPQDRFPEPDAGDSSTAVCDSSTAVCDTSGTETDTSGASFDTSGVIKNAVTCDDLSLSTSRTVKSAEVLHTSATTRAGGARSADAQGITTTPTVGRPTDGATVETCGLCDADGFLLTTAGYRARLSSAYTDEVVFLECEHSMGANVAEVRRAVTEDDGYWRLGWTGYAEIDSLPDDYEEIGVTVTSEGIMDGARSRESYSALGNSE